MSLEAARRDTTALFAHCVGVLVLVHTGRIRMFGRDGRDLFVRYVRDMTRGLGQPTPAPAAGKAAPRRTRP